VKKMESVKVICELDVKFHGYGTVAKNAEAKEAIRKWVSEVLDDECSFIPLLDPVLECTQLTKTTVRVEE